MVNSITLTSSMRSNLASLKTIATQMDKTQNILSTGKKINNAIDNASSYYQARSLTNRASDLNSLLDSMSQGIQTLQAANEGIEAATAYLEQMKAVAEQANLLIPDREEISASTIKITADMTTDNIQAILSQGGTVVLTDDIIIDKTLILDNDVELIANGKTITYAGSTQGDSALKITANAKISGVNINYLNTAAQGSAVTIDGGIAEIDNISINATGYRVYGIQVWNDGELTLDNTDNIKVNGDYSHKLVNGNPDLWDGEYNTDMIVNQIGSNAPAAYSCKEYVPDGVSETDENFGQGTWYLPAEGEMMYICDIDYDLLDNGNAVSKTTKDVKSKINNTLKILNNQYDLDSQEINSTWFWSSSERSASSAWCLRQMNGEYLSGNSKNASYDVRPFQYLENCIDNTTGNYIEIGDVVYSDMSYGKVDEYDSTKTVVGVVSWVSEDKSSAKIVALTDLDSKKQWATTAIDPDTNKSYRSIDIYNIKNYSAADGETALTSCGKITVINKRSVPSNELISYQEQYSQILTQFDQLMEDTSYQGVNLLTGGSLDVIFNESRIHGLTVKGKDMRSDNIGIKTKKWTSKTDIKSALKEIDNAINTVRSYSAELGNNYTIIQTRQTFTDALTDVLETGADNLVLADMNETSAEYLMLQTRQQLAVNSLSLASQSAKSILSLF